MAKADSDDDRHALAVEVRVLWGEDPITVAYLSPPRSFCAGPALAVDTALFGGPRVPLVVVDDDGVSAVAPPGSAGTIQAGGRVTSFSRASGAGELRIALALGTKVSIALPAGAAASPYRGPVEARADVSVEIALVRAARAIARKPLLQGIGSLFFPGLIALSAILGPLACSTFFMPPLCGPVCDEPDPWLSAQLAIAELKEIERAREEDPDEPPPEPAWMRRTMPPLLPALPGDSAARWNDGAFDEAQPFEAPAEAEAFGSSFFCDGGSIQDGVVFLARPMTPRRAFCEWPEMTPFGARFLGLPPNTDFFGRDPGDLWSAARADRRFHAPLPSFQVARGGLSPSARARVTVKVRDSSLRFERERFERVLRSRSAALRECYELALRHDPTLAASFDLWVHVDEGGSVRPSVPRTPSDLAGVAANCMTLALASLSTSPRLARSAALLRVDMRVVP